MVYGQQHDATGTQHGIVRKIYNGGEIVYYTIKEGVEFGLCRVITDESVRFTIDNVDGEIAFLEIDHKFQVIERGGEHQHMLDWLTTEMLKA